MSKKAFAIERYSILIMSRETKYQTFCALCLDENPVRENLNRHICKLYSAVQSYVIRRFDARASNSLHILTKTFFLSSILSKMYCVYCTERREIFTKCTDKQWISFNVDVKIVRKYNYLLQHSLEWRTQYYYH